MLYYEMEKFIFCKFLSCILELKQRRWFKKFKRWNLHFKGVDLVCKRVVFWNTINKDKIRSFIRENLNPKASWLFRPVLCGEELYTQMVFFFFVQSILADRHNHCRELSVVSLEKHIQWRIWSLKFFLVFRFLQGFIGIKIFVKCRRYCVNFIHIFRTLD